VGDKRSDDEMIALFRNRVQPGYATDVDDVTRLRQAHLHQRQQALTAGNYFDVVAMFGQELDRIAQGSRRVIFKGAGDHD
jgi:hypothetical protein